MCSILSAKNDYSKLTNSKLFEYFISTYVTTCISDWQNKDKEAKEKILIHKHDFSNTDFLIEAPSLNQSITDRLKYLHKNTKQLFIKSFFILIGLITLNLSSVVCPHKTQGVLFVQLVFNFRDKLHFWLSNVFTELIELRLKQQSWIFQ